MTDLIQLAERFARERHQGQVRKGSAQEPYTVHLEDVVKFVQDQNGSEIEICAAWLHDTVEDCPPTSFAEIESIFGNEIASVVKELTDDKNLDKNERKSLQIVNASHKSPAACLVKIADKTSNLKSIATSPPADWSYERRRDYVIWAAQVVNALAFKPPGALQKFLLAVDQAEIANANDCLPTRQAQNISLEVLSRRAKRLGASPEKTREFLANFLVGALENGAYERGGH